MTDEPKYRKPIFKASGKNSFFEVFDNPSLDRMSATISIYDSATHKTTNRVTFYFNYENFYAWCNMIVNGQVDIFLDAKNGFPSADFAVPRDRTRDTMRMWRMEKTQKGNYQITITEREREDKWSEDAKLKDRASFYISPLSLYSLACKCAVYLQGRLDFPPQENTSPLVRAVENDSHNGDEDDLGIE